MTSATTSDNLDTWQIWNDCSTKGTIITQTTDTATDSVWMKWNVVGDTVIWRRWMQSADSSPRVNAGANSVTFNALPVDEAELARREEEAARRTEAIRKQAEEYEKKRVAAKERALALLMENLNEKQRIAYERDQCIPVDAPSGNRYLVTPGQIIKALDKDGKVTHKLCIHPKEDLPHEDVALLQKLMLENEEGELLRIANRHAA